MTTLKSLNKPSIESPQAIQKRFSNFTSNLQSFEETYKTSYSHGLESIYALENVDIKSVRRIETPLKTKPKRHENKKIHTEPLQEELDLGDEFKKWIPSFVKKEPIHVLELSRHAEKCLIENGKSRLGDLIGANLKEFVFLRGMGQGHIEEIYQKLNDYIEGHALEKCYQVDFSSWLKSLVAAHDRKKVFAFLESYDLTELISLSPTENMEVRKLTLEKKQEWMEELLSKIVQPVQKNAVWLDMQQIINVFFKPWIRQRAGFASKEELNERMQRMSTHAMIGSRVLSLLQSLYFEGGAIFNHFLQQVDRDVYCCDAYQARHYKKIIEKAKTYFYKPSVYYSCRELVGMLEREFSRTWIGYEEGYIEKILQLSPCFHMRKGVSGQLEIHLNHAQDIQQN